MAMAGGIQYTVNRYPELIDHDPDNYVMTHKITAPNA
jgi:hypothetical protein